MEGKHNGRQSNFELLRLLAMLMIVGSHYAAHGIELCTVEGEAYRLWGEGDLLHRLFTAFLNPGGAVGVGLLFMISGYFQIKKEKPSLTRLALECYFYAGVSLVLAAAVLLAGGTIPGMAGKNLLAYLARAVLIPITSTCWWFVAVYVFLMLLSPVVNRFLLSLNRRGFLWLLLLGWALWYAAAQVLGTEFFDLQKALFFYSLGAYLRLWGRKVSAQGLKDVLAALLGWGAAACCFYLDGELALGRGPFGGELAAKGVALLENGFAVPLCAFGLFRLFSLSEMGVKPGVNRLAATTFGVYLLHDSLIARPLIWYSLLKPAERQYPSAAYPLRALLTILGLFLLCAGLDYLRLHFLEPGALKKAEAVKEKLKARFGAGQPANKS